MVMMLLLDMLHCMSSNIKMYSQGENNLVVETFLPPFEGHTF